MSANHSGSNGSSVRAGPNARTEDDRNGSSYPLHRVGAVREQEGISYRRAARKLRMSIGEVKQQEASTCDMRLSELHAWAGALHVPAAELIEEVNGKLSTPLAWRAKLVLFMKTARSILQTSKEQSIRRMAATLVEQLLELMPELADVQPWQVVGASRLSPDYGMAAEHVVSTPVFTGHGE